MTNNDVRRWKKKFQCEIDSHKRMILCMADARTQSGNTSRDPKANSRGSGQRGAGSVVFNGCQWLRRLRQQN